MPAFKEYLQTAITQAVFDAKIDDQRLVVRRIFDTDTYYINQPVPGHKIAVPIVENAGRATQVPHGESKAVGESNPIIETLEHRVMSIKSRFRVTKDEVVECANAYKNGYGLFNATDLKIQNIRRQIDIEEERIVLMGSDATSECKGLLYSDRSYSEQVKSWFNNATTNLDILEQLTHAMMYMQDQGVGLNDIVLMVSSPAYAKLMRPYSDANSMSLLSWIKNESGLNIDENRVYVANLMRKDYIKSAVPMGSKPISDGAFLLCSRNPQDITLGTVQDIQVNEMREDGLGGYEGSCDLSTAGALIKFAGSSYVGLGNEA